jgi:hypothetical protein
MDVFVLSLLSLVIFLGCMGLKQESQKKEIDHLSQRFNREYGDMQVLAEPNSRRWHSRG